MFNVFFFVFCFFRLLKVCTSTNSECTFCETKFNLPRKQSELSHPTNRSEYIPSASYSITWQLCVLYFCHKQVIILKNHRICGKCYVQKLDRRASYNITSYSLLSGNITKYRYINQNDYQYQQINKALQSICRHTKALFRQIHAKTKFKKSKFDVLNMSTYSVKWSSAKRVSIYK